MRVGDENMKLQLLVATTDKEYSERFSSILFKHYSDVLQTDVCTQLEKLNSLLENDYDIVLIDSVFLENMMCFGQEPIILKNSELLYVGNLSLLTQGCISEHCDSVKRIEKYQRISFIVQELLTKSEVTADQNLSTKVTVVWSPAGGVGKTTVALAYAAKKTSNAKVIYLDLDYFSSIPIYFNSNNRGISWVFQQLEDTDLGVHLEGVAETDASTGITFFGPPDNYDDINIFTVEYLKPLLKSLAVIGEEIVIDLPSACHDLTQKLFEEANKIFVVTDTSAASKQKLQQFATQHNVFHTYQEKICVVANKGSVFRWSGEQMNLPLVNSDDDKVVFKTLATKFVEN